jgi:ketosteroid isomerase-like protein
MSRENVQVVERAWEAWRRGDLDAVLSFYTPDAEFDFGRFEGWVEAEVLRGTSEIRGFLSDWRGSVDSHDPVMETVLDAEDDRVLGLVRERGRGHGSSAELELQVAHLYTLSNGLITRLDLYSDRAEALEAVGLSE